MSRIFKENVNFEIDVKENLWWHGIETLGIVCDLFKLNIIIYSIPNPKTLVFIHVDENIGCGGICCKNEFDIMEKFINNARPTII